MAIGLPDLETLWPTLRNWSYVIVFLVIFLEAFPVVGTIVPGGFLLIMAGFASSQGALDPFALAFAAILGAILGDTVGYEVGSRYGPGLLARYRGRAFLPEGMVARTERAVRTHTWAAVTVGRFNTFTRAIAPILSGIVQVPRRRYLLWNVVGGIAWAGSHVAGGFFFGQGFLLAYDRIGRDAILIAVLALAAWWGYKKWSLLHDEEASGPPSGMLERVGASGGEPPR